MSGHAGIPVNGALVRLNRLELGMSTRDVADHSGLSSTVIDSIEKDDSLAPSLTIADVRRLAHAVGLTVVDLLLAPLPPEEGDAPPIDDVQRLAGAIQPIRTLVRVDDIAAAFGWTISRVNAAANSLDLQLHSVGLRVHRNRGFIGVRPREPIASADTAELMRKVIGREGMNVLEARLLRETLLKQSTFMPKAPHQMAFAHLMRTGIVRPGARREPFHVLTEEAEQGFRPPPT